MAMDQRASAFSQSQFAFDFPYPSCQQSRFAFDFPYPSCQQSQLAFDFPYPSCQQSQFVFDFSHPPRQRFQQEDQLISSFQQFRPFSRSARPTTNILQYINPNSDKATTVFQAHYRHVGKTENSYKTVMCLNWLEKAECRFGTKCRFAHGPEELRVATVPLPINDKYKTRLCDKYASGVCPFGERCLFIHPKDAPSAPSAFSTSLPLSLFRFQCHQKQLSSRQSRNLLPHIEEELRREREDQKWSGLADMVDKLTSTPSFPCNSSTVDHL
uniref:C3H1-type domain-containing protein n=1 Tax=Globodera rostochiensis TaxID=31243 RepID=A0A914GYM5_GLORO